MSARLVYWQTSAIWSLLLSLFGEDRFIRIIAAILSLLSLVILGSYETAERKRDRS